MARCDICGTQFDEKAYQVVLGGRAQAFDRIDCALRARVLAGGAQAAFAGPLPALFIEAAGSGPRPAAIPLLAALRARLAVGGAWLLLVSALASVSYYLLSRLPGAGARSSSAPVFSAHSPAVEGERVRPLPEAERTLAAANPAVASGRVRPGVPIRLLAKRQTRPGQASGSREASGGGTASAGKDVAGGRTRLARPAADTETRSARPGWGHGDSKHSHTGPRGKNGSSKHGSKHAKRHGHKHKHG